MHGRLFRTPTFEKRLAMLDCFGYLPDEVITHIVTFLKAVDRTRFYSACRTLKKIEELTYTMWRSDLLRLGLEAAWLDTLANDGLIQNYKKLYLALRRVPSKKRLSDSHPLFLYAASGDAKAFHLAKEKYPIEEKDHTFLSSYLLLNGRRFYEKSQPSYSAIDRAMRYLISTINYYGIFTIKDLDLSGYDLRGLNLEALKFLNVNLSKANLQAVSFRNTELDAVDLSHVALRNIPALLDIEMRHIRLSREGVIELYEAGKRNFSGFNLRDLDLSRLDLKGVDFSYADLENTNFSGSILIYASFITAHLYNSNFSQADLRGVKFNRLDAKCKHTSAAWMQKTCLRGAVLHDAVLLGCHIEGSDLSKADFTNANLDSVSFKKNDLRKAIFSRALVTNANFKGSNLSGAVFEGAYGLTIPRFTDTIFEGTHFSHIRTTAATAKQSLINILLNYAASHPAVAFFSGHWNRHHASTIRKLLTDVAENDSELDIFIRLNRVLGQKGTFLSAEGELYLGLLFVTQIWNLGDLKDLLPDIRFVASGPQNEKGLERKVTFSAH